MNSVSPVLTERELTGEQVIALEHDEYYPIIVARVHFSDASIGTFTRFRFTDRERAAIAQGADLILSQPHHGPLMPIALQLAFPSEYPLAEEMLK
jgi:hypothetical protein